MYLTGEWFLMIILVVLEADGIKYISAMDKNQIENITEIDFTTFPDLDPKEIDKQVDKLPEFKKINENTYCREIKVDGKRRYILCFNPQLFKDQQKARPTSCCEFSNICEAAILKSLFYVHFILNPFYLFFFSSMLLYAHALVLKRVKK